MKFLIAVFRPVSLAGRVEPFTVSRINLSYFAVTSNFNSNDHVRMVNMIVIGSLENFHLNLVTRL